MISLRQLRSFVAVYEEASFTRAATRENATQSGISQHVRAVEEELGIPLFERTSNGVTPTAGGGRYYTHAIEVLRLLEEASSEARAAASGISGSVRAGLMPMFTRAALPPVLERFLTDHPEIDAQIIEGYSGSLTDMVREEALDFALVPAGPSVTGLTVTHLVRDREMLVSGHGLGVKHGRPINLSDLPPLNMIVPGRANVRREKLEEYFETHNVKVARLLEMDAMMGTLELVALGEWVSILPGLLCVSDLEGRTRRISPIDQPPLYGDFVVIEPSRRPLSAQAKLFLDAIRTEIDLLAQSI